MSFVLLTALLAIASSQVTVPPTTTLICGQTYTTAVAAGTEQLFTFISTGRNQFDGCPTSSSLDTVFAIYDSTGTTTVSTCDDCGNCGLRGQWDFTTGTIGTTYLFGIKFFSSSSSGTIVFNFGCSPVGFTTAALTTGAPLLPLTCGQQYTFLLTPGQEQRYSFVYQARRQFDTCPTSNGLDTYVTIYDATGTTTVTTCDDCGDCGVRSVLDWNGGVAGTTYVVGIRFFSSSTTGTASMVYGCAAVPTSRPIAMSTTGGPMTTFGSLTPLTCGSTYTFALGGSNPRERYYSFIYQPRRQFDTCLTSSTLDTYVTIYTMTGAVVQTCDDCGDCGLRSVLDWALGTPGQMYVVGIRFFSSSTTGTASMVYGCAAVPTARPTGGSFTTSMPLMSLTCGQTYTFFVGAGGEQLYSFTYQPNRQFNTCMSNATDTYITIYSATGTLVTTCDDCGDCGPGGSNLKANLNWGTGIAGASYIVGFRHFSSTATGFFSFMYGCMGPTTLIPTVRPSLTTQMPVMPLTCGQTYSFFVGAGGEQLYSFTYQPNRQFNTCMSNATDTYITIYTTNGYAVQTCDDCGSCGPGGSSLRANLNWLTGMPGQTYIVGIRHFSSTASGPFEFMYGCAPGFTTSAPLPMLTCGQTYSFFVPAGGEQLYSFTFQSNRQFSTCDTNSSIDTVVTIYGTNTQTIDTCDDCGGCGFRSDLDWSGGMNGMNYIVGISHYLSTANGTMSLYYGCNATATTMRPTMRPNTMMQTTTMMPTMQMTTNMDVTTNMMTTSTRPTTVTAGVSKVYYNIALLFVFIVLCLFV